MAMEIASRPVKRGPGPLLDEGHAADSAQIVPRNRIRARTDRMTRAEVTARPAR
jgi:hypothetical protein